MKFLLARLGIAVIGSAALIAVVAQPAAAAGFIADQAGMFSAATIAQLDERISAFNAQTGKQIVVVTTPTLGGATLQSAAASAFTQRNVNGVLIFIVRDDRRDIIVPDRAGAQAGWFTPDVLRSIRTAMEAQFRAEDYDAGIAGAVNALLGIYRAHAGNLAQPASGTAAVPGTQRLRSSTGGQLSMFWWILIIVVGFLIVRSIVRAISTPRTYEGAAPPPGTPPGTPPGSAPGPGYGPGYGYGGFGGGGSFWSGLLGGLGGAWLGNELFRGGGMGAAQAGPMAPDAGDGWQSDAGQADPSGASAGDWSGGGFGSDFGGSGDAGGGGGDSGGGW